MSSTRNKNTYGNYGLEQRQFGESEQYTLYPNSQYGSAVNTAWCGNGLLPGGIYWQKLSYNAADTESFLFGVGSTNLTKPLPAPFKPEIVQLPTVNIFEKGPTFIPQPLIIEKNQRPFPT
jgi:hypothetical protein